MIVTRSQCCDCTRYIVVLHLLSLEQEETEMTEAERQAAWDRVAKEIEEAEQREREEG